MPTMFDIYEKHSFEYDELVSHEDYQNNLKRFLRENFHFSGKSVLEFGAGTGRVTRMYGDLAKDIFIYDGYEQMLNKAKENLNDLQNKIQFGLCDNDAIKDIPRKGDILLEGWSFGHSVSAHSNCLSQYVDGLVNDCRSLLNSGGSLVIIETLGTNVKEPAAPNDELKAFYHQLENELGFFKNVIRTDYRFSSQEEARRIMGFFFGPAMGENLRFLDEGIVQEFTGVWHLKDLR